MKKITIDEKKDVYDDDEIYCSWYKCPNCKETDIIKGHNYCPMCGAKITWR